MALLVTGSKGYVGSYFSKSLPKNETIYCPSHLDLDLNDFSTVDSFFNNHKIDVVLHLAACLDSSNDSGLFQSNIIGVYYLLHACIQHGIEYFCFVSGNNVYGSNSSSEFGEQDILMPDVNNRYGISKMYGELVTQYFLSSANIPYSIVRIGDIYGPNQKTGALIKAVINNIITEQPQKLYGIGDRTRDYIFIDDVVDGLKYIIHNRLQGTYNLATGVGTSVLGLISYAEELSRCNEKTINIPVIVEDHSKVVLNVNKLSAAGFDTQVNLLEGLKRIIEEENTNE